MKSTKSWIEIEKYENEKIDLDLWNNRNIEIAKLVSDESESLLDLGCGNRQLEKLISAKCKYYPVDYCNRGENTIVCDFNNHQFPEVYADIVVGSGILEHIIDYKWFIKCMCDHCKKNIIVSYAYSEEGNPEERRHIYNNRYEIEWMNSLSINDLIDVFNMNDFIVKNQKLIPVKQVLIEFVKKNK